jgi:membrane-anchored protein YejM (alkaline phosphatase superfamily)
LLFDGTDIAMYSPAPGERLTTTVQEALAHLPKEQPLFLLVHYMDVHNWEHTSFRRLYPRLTTQTASRRQVEKSYAEAVREYDRVLPRLVDWWRAQRGFDDTMIVFFSDHGEHLLDPLLGHGNSMKQVLLHVPLLVHYPAGSGVAPGAVDQNVSIEDLFATTLDVAGIPHVSGEFEGVSLLKPADAARPLFADFTLFGERLSVVIRGNEKLVTNLDRGVVRLIRITGSGNEDSAAGSDAGVDRRALAAWLARYVETAQQRAARVGAPRLADQSKTVETLRSLGYLR